MAATTRGRGTAEAGLISVAIAPNDDASALGDIKATANQGSAVAGAFTITNGYATSEQVGLGFRDCLCFAVGMD